MLGGIIWVLMLPLQQYSRQTYISENALLPGQVSVIRAQVAVAHRDCPARRPIRTGDVQLAEVLFDRNAGRRQRQVTCNIP